MNHQRLDQLSDGIFAIVMTILVFEIHFPQFTGATTNLTIWEELQNLLPPLLSYILSFALLFTYWRAHHFFVTVYAKNVDHTLTNINALFFMLVSLVPFSTSLLGRYPDNEISVWVFGGHITLIGLVLYWMRYYVFYSDTIKNPEIAHRAVQGSTIRTLAPVFFALLAIGLSFYDVRFSIGLFTLAVVFNLSSTSTRMFAKLLRLY
jgi:uncharacterized membrane protein